MARIYYKSLTAITKCDRKLLQSLTDITKFDRKLLENVTGITKSEKKLLQSMSGIAKCNNYYKVQSSSCLLADNTCIDLVLGLIYFCILKSSVVIFCRSSVFWFSSSNSECVAILSNSVYLAVDQFSL